MRFLGIVAIIVALLTAPILVANIVSDCEEEQNCGVVAGSAGFLWLGCAIAVIVGGLILAVRRHRRRDGQPHR